MKKILAVLLFSFFVSQSVLAEYSLDYVDTKKRGNMDQNVKCTNDHGESVEYGFKTINGKKFVFEKFEGGVYGFPRSTVKVFNKKINDIKLEVNMTFGPIPEEFGIGSGIVLSVLFFRNDVKKFQEWSYFVRNNKVNNKDVMLEDWYNLLTDNKEIFDQKLHEWSERAFDIVSKQLDFGEPFELVDLQEINKDGLIDNLAFVQKCKRI